jgi:hypothetical protein
VPLDISSLKQFTQTYAHIAAQVDRGDRDEREATPDSQDTHPSMDDADSGATTKNLAHHDTHLPASHSPMGRKGEK